MSRSRALRAGFTLPELLVAVAASAIVMAVVVTLLAREQRFYAALGDSLTLRAALLDGSAVLSADLRTASVADSLAIMSDTAVEFYSTLGASVICGRPAADRLLIPAEGSADGPALTVWSSRPDSDDFATLYPDSGPAGMAIAATRVRLTGVRTLSDQGACVLPAGSASGSPMLLRPAIQITTASGVPVEAVSGSTVRFLRRVRYSAYRASDRQWYLGYRRCGLTACEPIQPVSGPFSAGSLPPLTLFFYTSTGARIPPPARTDRVARIDLLLRAAPPLPARRNVPAGPSGDSVTTTIALRNAP